MSWQTTLDSQTERPPIYPLHSFYICRNRTISYTLFFKLSNSIPKKLIAQVRKRITMDLSILSWEACYGQRKAEITKNKKR